MTVVTMRFGRTEVRFDSRTDLRCMSQLVDCYADVPRPIADVVIATHFWDDSQDCFVPDYRYMVEAAIGEYWEAQTDVDNVVAFFVTAMHDTNIGWMWAGA